MLRKAFTEKSFHSTLANAKDLNEIWKALFLSPYDYSHAAVRNKDTRVNYKYILLETHGLDRI